MAARLLGFYICCRSRGWSADRKQYLQCQTRLARSTTLWLFLWRSCQHRHFGGCFWPVSICWVGFVSEEQERKDVAICSSVVISRSVRVAVVWRWYFARGWQANWKSCLLCCWGLGLGDRIRCFRFAGFGGFMHSWLEKIIEESMTMPPNNCIRRARRLRSGVSP